eukprot:1178500-Prorocentrum_minimum.AAC.3
MGAHPLFGVFKHQIQRAGDLLSTRAPPEKQKTRIARFPDGFLGGSPRRRSRRCVVMRRCQQAFLMPSDSPQGSSGQAFRRVCALDFPAPTVAEQARLSARAKAQRVLSAATTARISRTGNDDLPLRSR